MSESKPHKRLRYFVTFSPVGWQVIDRQTGEEQGWHGSGKDEYARANKLCDELNTQEATCLKS